jgi:hypothetical protein
LGPILCAIFISSILDIVHILTFANDSHNTESNCIKEELKKEIEKSPEAKIKRLKKSGLRVNNEETKLCLFYRHDTVPVNVCLGDSIIKSKQLRSLEIILIKMNYNCC